MIVALCGIINPVKLKAEYVEGTEAWTRFQATMKKVLAVPHAEIQARIAEHRRETAKNPHRRGPKTKRADGRGPAD